MDRFWSSASRSAFYHEAFQTQFQPAKPNKDLLEKLNAISLTGPLANQSYFQELAKDVLGVTVPTLSAEGFQAGQPSTSISAVASLDQMLTYIDTPLTTATPNRFQTAPQGSGTPAPDVSTYSTLSQIDQLEQFYTSADATRTQLLTDIRNYIWNQISTYQTIVGNVTSIRLINAGDETTVNNYTESGIKNMDEADLVTAWNNYLSAKSSFLDTATTNVDKELTAGQSLYDRLYRTYNRFRGLESVTNISTAVTAFDSTIQNVPTMASLQASNYATVNSFFNSTDGYLRILIEFVRAKLGEWEDAYNQAYQQLRSRISSIPAYTDKDLTNSTAEQLISLMNEFGGVAPIETAGPAAAPSGLITQLVTGTYQEQAIATVRAFYRLLVENILVFTSSAEITDNQETITVPQKSYTYLASTVQSDASLTTNLKTLIGTLTSTNAALQQRLGQTDLTTTDQKAIANVRARYEAGTQALFERVKNAMLARLDEYKALHDMKDAFASVSGIPTNSVDTDKPIINGFTYEAQGTLPQLRYRYFISDFKALVSAFQPVYGNVRKDNETVQSTDTILATKPTLPTVASPPFSAVNPVTQPFDLSGYQMKVPTAFSGTTIVPDIDSPDFGGFFDTYFNSTNPSQNATVSAVYDLRTMANVLRSSIRAELVYRHELAFKIFKEMFTVLGQATFGFNSDVSAAIQTEASKTWTVPAATATAADLKAAFDSFVGNRDAYNTFIRDKVNPALTEYDTLFTKYTQFRQSALRLNPAPSSFFKNTELIDSDIAALSAPLVSKPTSDSLDGLNGTDMQNALFTLAKKYGMDGVAKLYEGTPRPAENLLPQLIQFTKAEVADYIKNYKARYVSLAPSTRTLASPTTADADAKALESNSITAASVVNAMSNYATFTTGMLESVDRNAVLEKMLEFNAAYIYNQNVMETHKATTYNALKKQFGFTSAIPSIFTSSTPSIATQISQKFSTDTDTMISGSYSVTTITSTYNLYDQALRAMNASLITDLSNVKLNLITLVTNFNNLSTTYIDFAENTISDVGDIRNALSDLSLDMTMEAINAANDDILVQQTSDNVLSIKSQLSQFYTFLTTTLGKTPYSEISGKPSLSAYFTDENVATLSITISAISRSSSPETFFANCRLYSTLLVALNQCIENFNAYLTALKTSYKTFIMDNIKNFLAKYDADLREALKLAGPPNENYLAANVVCVIPSSTTVPTNVKCVDEGTTLAGENYKSEVRTNYAVGYPYIDYNTLDSDTSNQITLSSLEEYDSKYTDLIKEVSSLRGKLLGINEVRKDVLGYIQNYYNLYKKYQTYIDKVNTSTEFTTFDTDVTFASTYFTGIASGNYSSVSQAYNNLTEQQLRDTFLPYATASIDPQRSEGEKYRNLLSAFARSVIYVIDGFIADRNSPDNSDAIAARFDSLIPQLQDIGYTETDKTALKSPTITLDEIEQFLNKYVTSGSNVGLISKLDDALSSGNTSKKKRQAAIDAMNKYLEVYKLFNGNLFPSSTLYGSALLSSEFKSKLRKINDSSNSVYYLSSTGSTTAAFKALSDDQLDALAKEYYDGLPVTPAFNPSVTTTVNYTANYEISSGSSLIALIKSTLQDVMDKFQSDYNASGDAKYGVGSAFWDGTVLSFVQSDFRNVANMVTQDKSAVSAATNETTLQNYVDKYLVLDTAKDKKGLTLQLPYEVQKVKTLKDTRASAILAIQTYTAVYVTFSTLLAGYKSNELTFIATYYDIGSSSIKSAFNGLNVGNVGDALVFDGTTTNTLNGIITHFNGQTGQGIVNVFAEINSLIKGVIDKYSQTYANTSLFSSVLATTQRVGAPSAFYKDTAEFNRRVNADKTTVDTASGAKNANDLLDMYEKYVGKGTVQGYQRDLADLIDTLTETEDVRKKAQSVLLTYYDMQKRFVGPKTTSNGTSYTSILTPNQTNITGILDMHTYIQLNAEGVMEVTDSFYQQSNALVRQIESRYVGLSNTDSSINPPQYTLQSSQTPPNLSTTPLINIIRFYIFRLILDVNGYYQSNSDLLNLEGVVLDAQIQSSAFNSKIANDIGSVHSASLDKLESLEAEYVDLRKLIQTTVGPLGLTKLIRPNATAAAQAYLNLYDLYKPFTDIETTTEYSLMKSDYDSLNTIFQANDPKCTLRVSTDNDFLECTRKNYVNRFEENIIEGATCSRNINTGNNAYVRLLNACRALVKAKIDNCVTYYTNNKATIEENGVPALDDRIEYIIYPKPPSTMTEPTIDKQRLDNATHEQLWGSTGLLATMRSKYYVGASSIENLIRGAIQGGGELGDARRGLNDAIESMRALYTDFNTKLFSSSRNNYRTFIKTNTQKYITLMGPGSDTSAYIKTSGVNNISTTKLRELSIPNLKLETEAYKSMLSSGNDTLFSAIQSAIVQLFNDYSTAWNKASTVSLFADVMSPLTANWSVNKEYPALNPMRSDSTSKINDDIRTIQSQTNLTDAFTIFKEKQIEYLDNLFSNLDNAIIDATQAQHRYKCRDEMIRLNSLFTKNQGILQAGDKPTELTTAESYYITNKTYSDTFKSLTNTQLDSTKADMIRAYNSLLATVKTRLASLIKSFKDLRQSFFAFYDENKGQLGAVAEIDSLNPAALNMKDDASIASLGTASTSELEVDSIRNYYLAPAGSSVYETMMQIIQAYFDGGADAIGKYSQRFNNVFNPDEITIVTEAPFAYAAPTTAEERARVGTATPDELKALVMRYDTRFDYVRMTEARKKVAIAISDYWTAIPLGTAEMQTSEVNSALYRKSKEYIEDLNLPASSRGPTFPFKKVFYDINNETRYASLEAEFKAGESKFLESLRGQYEKEVTEFYQKIWPAYKLILPGITVPVENITIAGDLNTFIKDNSITKAVNSIIRNDGFPTKTTFTQMQKFVKDMKVFMMSQDYLRCITTDIAARNQTNPIQYLFDKPKPFITLPSSAFEEAFQQQPQQPQQPSQFPTSRYAPVYAPSSQIPSATDPFAQFRAPQPNQQRIQQTQQPQPQPPSDLFSAKGGTSRWASF